MNTICIMCPMGCPLTVTEVDGKVKVSGNSCLRGERYGASEFTHPVRVVTTLVKTLDNKVASIKTTAPVPKESIFDVLNYVKNLTVDGGAKIGDIVATNVLNLGADLQITSKPDAK